MSEEVQKQLASLSAKLGVSVEHLWGVLIRQAYIEAISSLCTVLVCLVLAAIALLDLDVTKLPPLVPEGPMNRRFLLENIDCLACEFAPLCGQFGRACIVSWEEGKPPVIEYAHALTMRSSEIRLFLRRKKN